MYVQMYVQKFNMQINTMYGRFYINADTCTGTWRSMAPAFTAWGNAVPDLQP